LVPEGGTIGPNSPFFSNLNPSEMADALNGLTRDQIASQFGLPLENQLSPRFELWGIQSTRPTTIFDSIIAPTTQNGWAQTGGRVQSLVIDRNAFTAPFNTGIKFP
jgi:hypothetical protein